MKIENSCICKYCGNKIDYFFIIRDMNARVEVWSQSEDQCRADVYSYGNGYRVTVRCPKPLCNKKNSFEYDNAGKYIGEIK